MGVVVFVPDEAGRSAAATAAAAADSNSDEAREDESVVVVVIVVPDEARGSEAAAAVSDGMARHGTAWLDEQRSEFCFVSHLSFFLKIRSQASRCRWRWLFVLPYDLLPLFLGFHEASLDSRG